MIFSFYGHLEDTVCVDLEGDLDLGHAMGRGGDVDEVELDELPVVLGHGSIALEHLDGDGVLVVGGGGEDLRLLGGDDGVTGDQLGHDAPDGVNTNVVCGDF